MYTSVSLISLLCIGAVLSNDENQAKLRFYYGSMDNYTELPMDQADQIFVTTWYDNSKKTVFCTHGFTGYPEGPFVRAIINAYLAQGDCNVVLLNWDKMAAMALPGLINSYLNWAVPNANKVGGQLAETLLTFSAAGMDLNNTHFVGHSLGAHVFGIAGNMMSKEGVPLPWITGLDPATGLDMKHPSLRLNPASAIFTDVVHTDPHKYGSKKDLGLVNFWPNFKRGGNVKQPGCWGGNSSTFTNDDFCSHNRSWQLWIDAMKNRGTLLGSHAPNFRAWMKSSKEERMSKILELGVFSPKAKPGSYYLITSDVQPFGLGVEGV